METISIGQAPEVDLFLAHPDALTPYSEDEHSPRARSFQHPEARANFLAGRALLRRALSYTEDRPARSETAWRFRPNRAGRPALAEEIAGVDFNLTHTRGLIACAVARGARVGVDAETLDRPVNALRIARHSFHSDETAALEANPDDVRLFFAYWTLKEAFYKATGSGIPFRMRGARFDLADGLRFRPTREAEVAAERWQFVLAAPDDRHLVAIALEAGSDPAPLRLHRWTARAFEPVEIAAQRSQPEQAEAR